MVTEKDIRAGKKNKHVKIPLGLLMDLEHAAHVVSEWEDPECKDFQKRKSVALRATRWRESYIKKESKT